MTFFSKIANSFTALPATGDIPSGPFLDACAEIVPLFDALGSVTFAPVKSDINGNITKLRGKLSSNPGQFATLQAMVQEEIAAKTTTASGSATDALLWLKRALSFILVFLEEVLKGQQDLTVCANTAYESTLKKYHNFLVKGIFALAVRAVPTREGFFKTLSNGTCDEAGVVEQMRPYTEALRAQLNTINAFYAANKLDS